MLLLSLFSTVLLYTGSGWFQSSLLYKASKSVTSQARLSARSAKVHLTLYYINILAYEAKLFYDSLLGVPLGGRIVLHALKCHILQ